MLGKWIGDRMAALGRGLLLPTPAIRRPNVVWICADDFTPEACGAYGSCTFRTPCLDRLASQGIRFDRAYCTCPLSTPSRQSFWTGRYPRSIGVTLSPTPLPDDEITFPTLLRRAGYEAAAFGKTHYYWPRRHEFDVCADWPEYETWREGHAATPADGDVLGPWRPFRDPAWVWLNSACLPYAAVDTEMFGTFLATRAAEYLAAEKCRPFFLYLSFYETHAPFWFPLEYRGRHRPDSFHIPAVGAADQDHLPEVFRELTLADKQGILAAYATSAEFLDKNVGLVLDALDRLPCARDTVVLFTSDHGYLLGQHGRFEKHCCFEPAVRAALLMRYAREIRPGRSTAALVELIDLVPTLLELCGVPAPSNLHGRSLVRLLRDQVASHREHVIVEYADNEEAMIRTERWKLIYSTGDRRRGDGYALGPPIGVPMVQLYDLYDDPGEETNLADRGEQGQRVEELSRALAEHLRRTARDPKLIPESRDIRQVLASCLAPHDVDLLTYIRRIGGKSIH
jgi:choline-sulfatase